MYCPTKLCSKYHARHRGAFSPKTKIKDYCYAKERVVPCQPCSKSANTCISTLRQGGKIQLTGNGGSTADAQHIAAEIVCRYA